MPTVVAMLADPAARRLALEQIGTLATVRLCETGEALLELVSMGGADAVVSDLRDVSGAGILSTFGALRRLAPHLPLVLFFVPTPAALREVPDIIAVSRGLSVVLRNYEHLGLALRPLLRPTPFRPFFLVSALKASPELRVGTAATWSGFSLRTLERALRRARLPGAGLVLGSCTALHAAWWLDVQGWSAKQVVIEMGFSHASGLIRVLQRYFGCSVKSLREEGGFQAVLYRFETSLLGDPVPPTRFPSL